MKILKIWDADYPWDVRVEKICNSLIRDGHGVHLICRNKARKVQYEVLDGLHIHRLKSITGSQRINEVLSFPAFFSVFWLRHTNDVTKKIKPDLILIRDLPLCLMAWFVGKINGIPVVFDMAENYPEQCKNVWRLKNFKLRNIILRNPVFARIVERISIKLVDHIFVVIEESKRRLVDLNVPQNKITVVRNTPVMNKINIFEKPAYEPVTLSKYAENFKIIYLGLLDENRGLTNVIKAMPKLKEKIKNIVFIVVGKGTYEAELKAMVTNLNLEDCVIFEGWIDYKYAPYYIDRCHVGVVPHHAIPGWHTTIPNKLFDYMQMAKPVIVTDVMATSRIVNEEKCGVVFKDKEPDDFNKAVASIYEHKLLKEMGINGQRAIKSKYNWDKDYIAMIQALKQIALGISKNNV